jgi:outer membrane protein assembly factor BamB
MNMRRAILAAALVSLPATASMDAQWPQWRGPNRDGVVATASVPKAWPAKLTPKWTRTVGDGYSSPVVAEGRVYVHSRQDPDEVVTALDLASGAVLWTQRYQSAFTRNKYANAMSKGPFSTPLVANGRLFTLGASAVLTAFDAKTGEVTWRKDWSNEIDTSRLFTGTAMSPIIAGGLLIVHVGDDDAGAFRALDPTTGAERWALPGHGPGYASPLVANFGATRQIVTMTDSAVVGVEIATGAQLWTIPFRDEWNENIVTPVVAGDILVVSGTRAGTLGYRIAKSGPTFAATRAWHNTDVPMYMSSPVVDGAMVYGFSNRRKGQLFCLDATTGTVQWITEGRAGTNASIQIAGSDLVVLLSEGDLLVVKRNPVQYEEVRRYKVGEATWGQPVILGQTVVIRDGNAVGAWAL